MSLRLNFIVEVVTAFPDVVRLWQNNFPDKRETDIYSICWKNIAASFKTSVCVLFHSINSVQNGSTIYYFETYEEAYEYFILLCL